MKPGNVLSKLCTLSALSRNGALDSSGTINLSIKIFCMVYSFFCVDLVADSNDFAYRGAILGCLEHEIGYVRTRDFETKTRQAAFAYSILSRVRLVCELWWADDRPVEPAFRKDLFHRRCISNRARKEQAAQKVCRRHDGILEQESH